MRNKHELLQKRLLIFSNGIINERLLIKLLIGLEHSSRILVKK